MRTLLKTAAKAAWAALWLLTPTVLMAQGTSPWVDVVAKLERQFTGPIARGLSLFAIVVGGLMFAFGEGGSKRTLAGIIFGIGMAVKRGGTSWPGCSDAGLEALDAPRGAQPFADSAWRGAAAVPAGRDACAGGVERDGLARRGRCGVRHLLRRGLDGGPDRPGDARSASGGDPPSVAVRSRKVGGRDVALASPRGRPMRVSEDLRAYEAVGSLAEELRYWGWLEGGRTCLTHSG